MASELTVYFARSKRPEAASWTAALRAEGIRLSIDPTALIVDHNGFLPVTLDGEESGFEFSLDPVFKAKLRPSIRHAAAGADCAAVFRYSADDEQRCVLAAAAVLTRMTGGVLFDPEADRPLPPEEALARFQGLLREFSSRTKTSATFRMTPATWRKRCLEYAQRVHPGYAAHREQRGNSIEYIRRDPSGLWVSHNFLHSGNTYSQGFAVLFSAKPSTSLRTPLMIGGRLDPELRVSVALERHLGRTREDLVDLQKWRLDSFDKAEKCMRAAEEDLLPGYRRDLARGSEALRRIYSAAAALLTKLNLAKGSTTEARERSLNVTALEIARGLPADLPEEAVVLHNIGHFLAVRDELGEIIRTAGALGRVEALR